MRFCHPLTLSFVALLSGCPGCPGDAPPDAAVRDAAVDARRDAGNRANRRRRRRGPRVASANGRAAPRNAPGVEPTNSAAELPDEGPVDEAPAPRPRITETGPMLPENLGPAPEVTYDMGGPGEGPMGLNESQVSRGLDPLLPRLGNCAAATTDDDGRGPHGRVRVRLRIRNDGRPTAAQVSGGGGSAEFVTCVRRVVASARFASFRGPDVIVGWGFDVD
ncbi:MAG: hypothetical protein U0324_16840 [Polyangiales bacterium]